MKQQRIININNQSAQLIDLDLTLELNSCGRGFMTVASQQPVQQGQLITLDLGDPSLMLRYFTGYIERAQPSENGYHRLFIREMAGALSHRLPLSLQHPTLKQICQLLTEKTGLPFSLPDKEYITKPIANLTHSGNGYQLLNHLGQLFAIADYLWQPLPNGEIFIGSYQDSYWYQKAITLPDALTVKHEAGNTLSIPIIQSLRPGITINGQRISQIRIHGDTMQLHWITRNQKGQAAQSSPLRRQIEKEYPELSGGQHLPRYARIEAISDISQLGDLCDNFRPHYAADIQLLDVNGQVDNTVPIYHAITLPIPMVGIEAGLMAYPPPGTIVEVAFNAGLSNQPFIRQILPFNWSLPSIKPGEQLQQQRAEVYQRFNSRGDIERATDQAIIENSQTRKIYADEEQRHLTERTTLINGNDTTTVVGNSQLNALGALSMISTGDLDIGIAGHQRNATEGQLVFAVGDDARLITGGDHSLSIGKNETKEIAENLNETIGNLRKSIANQQQLIAGKTWVGSEKINILQLLSQSLSVVQTMANLLANHTHPGDSGGSTGRPHQASNLNDQANALANVNKQLKSISL